MKSFTNIPTRAINTIKTKMPIPTAIEYSKRGIDPTPEPLAFYPPIITFGI